MDVPDWFWQGVVTNLFVDGLGMAAWLAWKYQGKLTEVYNHMLVLLAEILNSVALLYRHEELTPETDYSTELDELREVLRSLTKIDPFASIRQSIKDMLNVPVPRLQYVPYRFRCVPMKVSHQPMRLRYRPMKVGYANGLPRIVPAGVDLEPPGFKVTPPSFDFSPGGLRPVQG